MIRPQDVAKLLRKRRILLSGLLVSAVLIAGITLAALPGVQKNEAQATIADFKFAAVGDWGCNTLNDSMISRLNTDQYDKILGLGDYSYKTIMNCWHDKISNPTNNATVHNKMHGPTSVAIGNHEQLDCGGPCGNAHLNST